MFGDEKFGFAGQLRPRVLVLFVNFRAHQKGHDVRILLEGAGFAQVGHAGLAAPALLGLPVELGEDDDRDLEFLGQGLDAGGNFGNFDLAVVLSAAGGRAAQLQVVDGDQFNAVAVPHATRFGPQFEDGKARRVVDENAAFAQGRGRVVQLPVFGAGQHAGTDFLHVDARAGAEHALHELLRAHLQAEDTDRFRFLQVEGDVFDDVHGQGGFAHRWTRRDDDHLAGMQTVSHLVENGESGGQPADPPPLLIHFLDVFQRGKDFVTHVGRRLAEAGFPDGENLALHVIEQLRNIPLLLVTTGRGRSAGRDHAAQEGLLQHDVEIVRGIGRSGHEAEQFGDRPGATHGVENVEIAQAVGQRDHVNLLVGGPHLDQHPEDGAVGRGVECLLSDLLGAIVEHLARRKKDGPEKSPLRLDILRQRAMRIGRGTRRFGSAVAARRRCTAGGGRCQINRRSHASGHCETGMPDRSNADRPCGQKRQDPTANNPPNNL